MIFPEKTKYVNKIFYGEHELPINQLSPLFGINNQLFICSKCLALQISKDSLLNHSETCHIPPFLPIYEEKSFKISKISNLKTKQLLSMLGMMFIKRKTLFFEVSNYDYYIIHDKEIIGYYSRNRLSDDSLSCLCVFPCFQKQGWGSLLIDYSQIKTIVNGIPISDQKGPEIPLSKKAILCYRKYWKYKVLGAKSINQIAEKQNITINNAIVGLELNGFDFRSWVQTKEIVVEKPRLLSKKIYKKIEGNNQ